MHKGRFSRKLVFNRAKLLKQNMYTFTITYEHAYTWSLFRCLFVKTFANSKTFEYIMEFFYTIRIGYVEL